METKESIFYLDDNLSNLTLLSEVFKDNYEVVTASKPSEALEIIREKPYKVFIVDYVMPGMNGLEFVEAAREMCPDSIFMILTAYPDLDVTVSAINQGGIYRFIYKPWKIADLTNALEGAFETYYLKENNRMLVNELQEKNRMLERLKEQLEEENRYLQEEIRIHAGFEHIVSQNKSFKQLLKQIEQVAETQATVLIQGETGTGKELVARAVHSISNRNDKPFIKVNCAAIPESLIESELFGHVKGSFTGATGNKKGKFELAHNGTIFLDEIGELPVSLQSKLLRVLQEGEIEKIGDPGSKKVNVRVIAATNRNLEKEIREGNFRDDLYYRLNVFPISIPPLRERRDDIPSLVAHFMDKNNRNLGKTIKSVPNKTMDFFMQYNWPGNIRELENMIERAMILSTGNRLELPMVMPSGSGDSNNSQVQTLEEVERSHIIKVLESTGWRVSGERGAAKLLGMKPTTLESRLVKLGISKP